MNNLTLNQVIQKLIVLPVRDSSVQERLDYCDNLKIAIKMLRVIKTIGSVHSTVGMTNHDILMYEKLFDYITEVLLKEKSELKPQKIYK